MGNNVHAPSGGRKFVQTSAEDKLVWTMPSAAEFGETQEIIKDDFTGDKTMASVSLQSRLMLNCKLSRWAQDIGALTVIIARSWSVRTPPGKQVRSCLSTVDALRLIHG